MHLLKLLFFLIILNRCAEVDYLQRVVGLVVDDVFGLQVTMHHTEVVAIRNGLQQLFYDFSSLELRETYLVLDRLEKLDTLTQLCDEEVVDVVLEDLEYLHDVWMVQLPKDTQLGLKEFLLHRIHLCLLDDLDCPYLLSKLALTCPNFAKSTLTEDLTELVAVLELLLIQSNEVCLLNDKVILSRHGRLLDFFLAGGGDAISHLLKFFL